MFFMHSLASRLESLVSSQGGKLSILSDSLSSIQDYVKITCADGHRWVASAKSVLNGATCPKCKNETSNFRFHTDLSSLKDRVRFVVESQGGVVEFGNDQGFSSLSLVRVICQNRHSWTAPVGKLVSGGWCAKCQPGRTAKKSLEDAKRVAVSKGGECLSMEYVNGAAKLHWRCAKGHEWFATYNDVFKKSWCGVCARESRGLGLVDLQALAKERGGKCLAERYETVQAPISWACASGHEFVLSFYYARKGAWCPTCDLLKARSEKLEEIKAYAKKMGGECLSESYEGADSNIHWLCSEGHEWHALYGNTIRGKWCRKCNLNKNIAIYEKIAAKKGGKCLSTEYINPKSHLLFECKEGHRWRGIPDTVKAGAWCPDCAGLKKKTVEDMRDLASSRGFKFLSTAYMGMHVPVLWECPKGHQWRGRPVNVANGSGCPICSRGSHTFLELQEMAKKRGGEILSPSSSLKNGDSQLRAKCREGHVWFIRANALAKGSWCRNCAMAPRRASIEALKAYASKRGGELISEKLPTKGPTWAFFKCERGHVWHARADCVLRAETWCRKCSYMDRGPQAVEVLPDRRSGG